MIGEIWNKIDGYKTHIASIVGSALIIMVGEGWIEVDGEWFTRIAGAIYVWTGIAIRSAMKKIERPNGPP